MKLVRIASIASAILILVAVGYWQYIERIANPRVVEELIEYPDGERALKTMLLTLPSGRRIPVNFLREDSVVYAGADGSWWKELVGSGTPVSLLVRGESLWGTARAILDDPAYTQDTFKRLRPDAMEGFGTLVEIRLDATARSRVLR